MGKLPLVVISTIFTVLLISCQPTAQKRIVKQPQIETVFYLPTDVITVDKDLVTIKVEKPASFKGDLNLALELAKGIIEKSYLLEGMETNLDKSQVKVMRVMGNDVLLRILGKSHLFKPGQKVKIFLDKKTIAIRDFEVVMGRNKEVAHYVQEDVATALVNSGQFNVVERLKLKSVLEELKLSQAGLIDPNSAKKIGKLLGADTILTGTLAATGEQWSVNLRLINTEAGLIIAAFNKKGPLHELKPEAFRGISNIAGSFEGKSPDLSEWFVGTRSKHKAGKGGYQKVYLDETQGAKGTSKSLAMDFKLGSKRTKKFKKKAIQAEIQNLLKRDLSRYSGIKFYVKATKDLTLQFWLHDSQTDSGELENWYSRILVTKDWKEIQIPFNTLSLQRGKSRTLVTNQILELQYTEKLRWVVHENNVKRGTQGTVWLDGVTFY